jgi:hypothetical protein
LSRWWCQIPPRNCFFHRQADSHYASNLNHKVYTVMMIEDKEKPVYLLGYAYGRTLPFCHVTNRQSRRGEFSTKTLMSPRDSHHCLIIRIMSSTLSPIDVISRLHVSSLASSE